MFENSILLLRNNQQVECEPRKSVNGRCYVTYSSAGGYVSAQMFWV